MGSAVKDAAPAAYELHVGRYGRELAAAMVGVARLRRGLRAIDIGCGPGALTEALAALLGSQEVAAIDPSDAFDRPGAMSLICPRSLSSPRATRQLAIGIPTIRRDASTAYGSK